MLGIGLQTDLHERKRDGSQTNWEGHVTRHAQGGDHSLAVTFFGSRKNSFKNMGWQEVRQAKPQFGKTIHILLAAYMVGMSLQNSQIFLLKTNKTTAAATRPLGTWLHSQNTETGGPILVPPDCILTPWERMCWDFPFLQVMFIACLSLHCH